jgi:hypothetical protein
MIATQSLEVSQQATNLFCDCGNELDPEHAGELCSDCKQQAEEDAYWLEFNRNKVVGSTRNEEPFEKR